MKVALKILKGVVVCGAFVGIWASGVHGGQKNLGDNIIMFNPKAAYDLRKQAYEVASNQRNSERIRRKAKIIYYALENQIM